MQPTDTLKNLGLPHGVVASGLLAFLVSACASEPVPAEEIQRVCVGTFLGHVSDGGGSAPCSLEGEPFMLTVNGNCSGASCEPPISFVGSLEVGGQQLGTISGFADAFEFERRGASGGPASLFGCSYDLAMEDGSTVSLGRYHNLSAGDDRISQFELRLPSNMGAVESCNLVAEE